MYRTYRTQGNQIELGHKYFFVVDSRYAVAGKVTAIQNGNIVVEDGLEFTLKKAWRNFNTAPKKLFNRKEIPIDSARPLLKY